MLGTVKIVGVILSLVGLLLGVSYFGPPILVQVQTLDSDFSFEMTRECSLAVGAAIVLIGVAVIVWHRARSRD